MNDATANDLPRDFSFLEMTHKLGKYRFYGRGCWEKLYSEDGWLPINGIYIPADLIKIAADHCAPRA